MDKSDLLDKIAGHCLKDLASSKRYIEDLANYVRFALFALMIKALESGGASFGIAAMTDLLEKDAADPSREWVMFCKSGIDIIRAAYKKDGDRYRVKMRKELTIANFSKAQEYVGKLLERPLPGEFRQKGRAILRS